MERPDELSSDPDVQHLKAEISETQAELQQTVAEIQDRLSPAHLKDQAATTVRDATLGKVQHMMHSNSSIPYALIGIGAAWLLAGRSSDRQWNSYDRNEGGWGGEYSPGTGSSPSTTSSDWRDTASDRAAEVAERARYAAYKARTRWDSLLEENPLALGIAALAAGALIAASLPQTEVENQYLGETRDQMLDSAREIAHDAVEKVAGTDQRG